VAPVTEYVKRREPKPPVATQDEGRVTPSIASEVLGRRVELEAVDLDEEPVIDGHVDSPDTGQRDLLPDAQPETLEPLPRYRFDTGVRAGPSACRYEPVPAGLGTEDPPDRSEIDEPFADSRVECRHCSLGITAADDASQAVVEGYAPAFGGRRRVQPVDSDRQIRRRYHAQTRGVPGYGDVDP
jgi:hypothetical protein